MIQNMEVAKILNLGWASFVLLTWHPIYPSSSDLGVLASGLQGGEDILLSIPSHQEYPRQRGEGVRLQGHVLDDRFESCRGGSPLHLLL